MSGRDETRRSKETKYNRPYEVVIVEATILRHGGVDRLGVLAPVSVRAAAVVVVVLLSPSPSETADPWLPS